MLVFLCEKVDKELELCVGGRLNRPVVGIYGRDQVNYRNIQSTFPKGKGFLCFQADPDANSFELQGTEGGGPYDFIGYKVSKEGKIEEFDCFSRFVGS